MEKKRVVTIGGGTGSFTLLSGLVNYPIEISAIVSMADDGGSTGVLRDELGVLPPGDIRQCLVALSPAGSELRELLNFRFKEGRFQGHAFGNLFLSALEKSNGSFLAGLHSAERILNIAGEVIPVTGECARLVMKLAGDMNIYGEDNIENAAFQGVGMEKLYFDPEIKVNLEALDRIKKADVVVIGPGTFYSSTLANLALPEISEAIRETSAKIVFPVNLTNKKGHTSGFSVEDYVRVLEEFIGKDRTDIVLVNNAVPHPRLLERYQEQEGENALVDVRTKESFKKQKNNKQVFVSAPLLADGDVEPEKDEGDALAHTRSFIRHDPDKLACAIMEYLKKF